MGTRAYVAGLTDLGRLDDPDERLRTWRQGMAALAAAVADRRDAPLEGLDPQALLEAARIALADGLLADMAFLSPAAAATATFALAGGLPPGPERRELGRRVLEQLDAGDDETFASLATALALASRRPLTGGLKRARVAAALAAPLAAGTAADALALALLAGVELQRVWLDEPSIGSLPARRIAARVLERAAREVSRRHPLGDTGGLSILARPSVREVWRRLLADREALVWRHAAVARGLLAGVDRQLAEEIERDLDPASSPSAWRRGAASLAARVELDPGLAPRCGALLAGELLRRDAGVVRGLVAGLTGVFAIEPELADELCERAVTKMGLDAVEALVELRHELGDVAPRAAAAAAVWLEQARNASKGTTDDGHAALLAALASELGAGAAAVGGSLAAHALACREALRRGRVVEARRAAHAAADAAEEAIEFLERADDGDPVDRRHAFRTLRELERELLADSTVVGLLARGDDVRAGKSGAARVVALEERLEATLLAREAAIQIGPVEHPTLRQARLRALVRAVDADAATDDAGALRERRMVVVRTLLPRARLDGSPLRRAVWAALTRAYDALLRDEQLELSDLLCGWTAAMDPDEEFAIAREASMLPEVRGLLDAYARVMAATTEAADPDDREAAIRAIGEAGAVLAALDAASSPRTDVLRVSLGALVRALDAVVRARGQREVAAVTLDHLQAAAAVLADLAVGARRRLGLPVVSPASPGALRALAVSIERLRRGAAAEVAADATVAAVTAGDDQIPLVARLLGVALARLAQLPVDPPARPPTAQLAIPTAAELGEEVQGSLPRWLPPSRTLGGFYVMRPLGKGGGGSVFVACRVDERHEAGAEQVALKVPDYDGGAARNLSLGEFEVLFREEAGALLAVPAHPNLARFVTFDAGARPKPILVMEYVAGQTLEQLLDVGELDPRAAMALIDGIAAGLEAMHQARVAHLDLKPANVILRGTGRSAVPVLVDFGLAGRRLRPGCGSPHYGAPEIWSSKGVATEPFGADVYAFGCLVFEILTRQVLVGGESVPEVLTQHVGGAAETRARQALGRDPRSASVAELIAAAVQRRPEQRPTMARLRAGLASVAAEVGRASWPLGA